MSAHGRFGFVGASEKVGSQGEVMNVSRAPAGSFCVTAGLIIHHVQIWFGNARSWFQIWGVAALGGVIVGLQACECGIRTCGSTSGDRSVGLESANLDTQFPPFEDCRYYNNRKTTTGIRLLQLRAI